MNALPVALRQRVRIGAADRDVHALGRVARVGDRRGVVEAVRAEQQDLAVVAEHLDLVLDQLATVQGDDAAEEDGLRVLAGDALEERLVVGLVRVPLVVAEHRDAERLRGVHEVVRDADAVGLAVVQDVDALDALAASGTSRQRRPGSCPARQHARSCACPTGSTCCGSPGTPLGFVRPTYVLAGLTIAMPPPGARLTIGAMISAQPELKVPTMPSRFLTVL